MEASKQVNKVVLLHPDQFRHMRPIQRCFCGKIPNNKMVLCDGCDEWYHFDCVGLTVQQAQAEQNWRCGYCRSSVGTDGERKWILSIPQGSRKRPKVAPTRNDANTPKVLGIDPNDASELVGPSNWADFEHLAREGGRKINEKQAKYQKQAEALVKGGGHHVVDEVSLGGVVARGVDNMLVDDLLGQGLIQLDEDEEANDSE